MLRRPLSILGIALLVATTGCAGAVATELFGPEDNGGNGTSTESPASSTDSTTPAPGAGEEPGKPADETLPAPSEQTDPSGKPPEEQKPTCAAEGLDNDEFRNADLFDSCIAGKLIARDIDFVATMAPATAKQIFIKHSETGGEVAYRVIVNGYSASFTNEPPSSIPAIPGAKYTFKIERSGSSTTDRTWQLHVSFQ